MNNDYSDHLEQLNEIGIALSAEKNQRKLLEKILVSAQSITNADGGTLYLVENKQLKFEIVRTESQDVALGGTTNNPIHYAPIPLYHDSGLPDTRTVAACSAVSGQAINVEDVYTAPGFDFSRNIAFDKEIGYASKSLLTIPMRNHEKEVIGILQLINAQNEHAEIISFSTTLQKLTESLASQAAVALTNHNLINNLHELLETFIEVIVATIDQKSSFTGDHCRRVPHIATLLGEAVHHHDQGPLSDFKFSDEERYELRIAALLHDCGKIATPVHLVNKATKLETVYDRINVVSNRFELLKKDAEIRMLKRALGNTQIAEENQSEYQHFLTQLDKDLIFLQNCNVGGEFMADEKQQRVKQIALHEWGKSDGSSEKILSNEEVDTLNIQKGTLTKEERKILNDHIIVTIKMLESLPFPKSLRHITEIAGGHHERMDGKGYPKGLKREELSIRARIMGIADIFEALTSGDRPYKKVLTLSQSLKILSNMTLEGHIDPDIFDIFIKERVYMQYAEKFLQKNQIDDVDLTSLAGFECKKSTTTELEKEQYEETEN
ncbi:Chemotactic transducer-related protein [hydrothermal vent metagenome]|uniref:Chemotactic transducer-related protein n=1 Tax=hydrothermal vent metagenome TaxID=652676 RepID=A0A3B0ZST5_9ZZZZ